MKKLIPGILAACLLLPATATAEWRLGADGSAIFPTDDVFDGEVGFGVDVRLGYELPLPILVTPELQLGYANFSRPEVVAAPDAEVLRGMVGGRVGFGAVFRPAVFLHVGYANYSTDVEGALDTSDDTFAWDAGLSLDLRLAGVGIDVGGHVAYNAVNLDDDFELELPGGALDAGRRPVEWVSAGVHVSFPLD